MGVSCLVRLGVAVIASAVLGACGGSDGGVDDSDCVSVYDPVARAATWAALQDAMLSSTKFGRVASVRTQARGHDVGAGDQVAVRVVDLLNRNGRRLVQADVWRTDAGAWSAGVWEQCID
jgi:hypothetical protein